MQNAIEMRIHLQILLVFFLRLSICVFVFVIAVVESFMNSIIFLIPVEQIGSYRFINRAMDTHTGVCMHTTYIHCNIYGHRHFLIHS